MRRIAGKAGSHKVLCQAPDPGMTTELWAPALPAKRCASSALFQERQSRTGMHKASTEIDHVVKA